MALCESRAPVDDEKCCRCLLPVNGAMTVIQNGICRSSGRESHQVCEIWKKSDHEVWSSNNFFFHVKTSKFTMLPRRLMKCAISTTSWLSS